MRTWRVRSIHAALAAVGVLLVLLAVSTSHANNEQRHRSEGRPEADSGDAAYSARLLGAPQESQAYAEMEVADVGAAAVQLGFTPMAPQLSGGESSFRVVSPAASDSGKAPLGSAVFEAHFSTASGEFDMNERLLADNEDAASVLVDPAFGFDDRFMSRVTVGGHVGVTYDAIDAPPVMAKDGTMLRPGVTIKGSRIYWTDGRVVYRAASIDLSSEQLLDLMQSMYE